MKKAHVTTAIMAVVFIGLTTVSCNDSKKESARDNAPTEVSVDDDRSTPMDDGTAISDNTNMNAKAPNSEAEKILANYMTLKNALVETDEKTAANAGKTLENSLNEFSRGSYTSEEEQELKTIMKSAVKHATEISQSEMVQQREHFEVLTKDITDMVAITGTSQKLYQQYCPMYRDNKGGQWLSMEKEIRNPYFGNKMLKCGTVQKEIN